MDDAAPSTGVTGVNTPENMSAESSEADLNLRSHQSMQQQEPLHHAALQDRTWLDERQAMEDKVRFEKLQLQHQAQLLGHQRSLLECSRSELDDMKRDWQVQKEIETQEHERRLRRQKEMSEQRIQMDWSEWEEIKTTERKSLEEDKNRWKERKAIEMNALEKERIAWEERKAAELKAWEEQKNPLGTMKNVGVQASEEMSPSELQLSLQKALNKAKEESAKARSYQKEMIDLQTRLASLRNQNSDANHVAAGFTNTEMVPGRAERNSKPFSEVSPRVNSLSISPQPPTTTPSSMPPRPPPPTATLPLRPPRPTPPSIPPRPPPPPPPTTTTTLPPPSTPPRERTIEPNEGDCVFIFSSVHTERIK